MWCSAWHRIKLKAFNDLPYPNLISIPIFCSSNLASDFSTKQWEYYYVRARAHTHIYSTLFLNVLTWHHCLAQFKRSFLCDPIQFQCLTLSIPGIIICYSNSSPVVPHIASNPQHPFTYLPLDEHLIMCGLHSLFWYICSMATMTFLATITSQRQTWPTFL